ncbi:MAG: type II toxin-antitoxin system HicA family toxin [Candidatus Omnitrophica bacterium]|nr:type II toxin-antitoxin system HicA family toxin [Candidatus Omnitrophota bacterium]
MSGVEKILEGVLRGTSDQNIAFASLCLLLRRVGFEERVKGSHHIFTCEGVEEIINVQPQGGGKAKPYQVKQVRNLILRYKLGGNIR